MSTPPVSKAQIGNAFKIYLFPSLISIVSLLIWRDLSELRADVKALLAQSNIDKTRIEQLQRDVEALDQAVFHKKIASTFVLQPHMDQFFKHEEIYDLSKNLKSEETL